MYTDKDWRTHIHARSHATTQSEWVSEKGTHIFYACFFKYKIKCAISFANGFVDKSAIFCAFFWWPMCCANNTLVYGWSILSAISISMALANCIASITIPYRTAKCRHGDIRIKYINQIEATNQPPKQTNSQSVRNATEKLLAQMAHIVYLIIHVSVGWQRERERVTHVITISYY